MTENETVSQDFAISMRALDSPTMAALDLVYKRYGYYFYPGKPQQDRDEIIFPIHAVIPIHIRDAVTHKERRFSYSFEQLGNVRMNRSSLRIVKAPRRKEIFQAVKDSREKRWQNIRSKLLFSVPERFGQSPLIRHALIPVRTIAEAVLRDKQISVEVPKKPEYLNLMFLSKLLYQIDEKTYGPSRELLEIYDRKPDFELVGYYAIGVVVATHYDRLRARGIRNIQPWVDMSTWYYEKAIGCDELVTLDRHEFLESFTAGRYRSRWKYLRAETWLTGLQKTKVFAEGKNVIGEEEVFEQVRGIRPELHMVT